MSATAAADPIELCGTMEKEGPHTNPGYVPDPDDKGSSGVIIGGTDFHSDTGSGGSTITAILGEEITSSTDPGPRYTLPSSSSANKEVKGQDPSNPSAVTIRNAHKRYGKGPPVLTGLDMTIPKGTIYSLLGSSGCGKTTLLACMVGLRQLNSGEICVFGAKPGTKESGVPGRRVGYMPQDLALYNDFSIDESLFYYGMIYSMSHKETKASRDFLIAFLDLPKPSRRIGTLSGGEKRRVSLAISLIHAPELLILDEPTVGVDPLLRESIWNHLCHLVYSKGTTVIITTHYIEESRNSNTIGLMRGGRLLAEKSPQALISEYGTSLLEDIMLKICRSSEQDNVGGHTPTDPETTILATTTPNTKQSERNSFPNPNYDPYHTVAAELTSDPKKNTSDTVASYNRIRALVRKNFVVMTRNWILLIFMILVPAAHVLAICLGIGNEPKPMKMGVVNYESNYSSCHKHHSQTPAMMGLMANSSGVSNKTAKKKPKSCSSIKFSCRFLDHLPNDTIYLTEYANETSARDAVHRGEIWGFMTFPTNFSDSIVKRMSVSGQIKDNATLEGSNIYMDMDLTNKMIAASIKRVVHSSYADFIRELLIKCGMRPEVGEMPIKYREPIYGTDDTDFKEFVAPSILMGIVFFFPLSCSSVSLIWDKKQGTLERALVAGVTTVEIMTAFFISEGVILCIQAGISFSIITVLYAIPIKGSAVLAFALTLLMGLGGVSSGFLVASFCNEELEAVLISMASLFPNFLISGMLWPIQGLPKVVQYIAYIFPCTLASESIRSIISRGWSFTHIKVWPGFAVMLCYITVFWTATIIIHKVVLSKK